MAARIKRGRFANLVYATEHVVWAGRFRKHLRDPDGLTVADAQAIVDDLCRAFGLDPIKVERTNGKGTAGYAYITDGRIRLDSTCGPAYICHEVAHHLANERGHGPEFRNHYVGCVRHLLGDYHADRLYAGFVRAYGEAKATA